MQKWILNSAKAIGLSHIDERIPCQDSVMTLSENGVDIAVLSDGCGSSHFSHYGSSIVVDVVGKYICNHFDEIYKDSNDKIKRNITHIILDSIEIYAEKNINKIDEYFATEEGQKNLKKVSNFDIMSVLSKDDSKRLLNITLFDATVLFVALKKEKCLIGHCGDGFILGAKDGTFEILSEEEKSGERNVTNYPSSVYYLSKGYANESVWDNFRIKKIDENEYQGFTLMSDGAEKSLMHINKGISTPVIKNNELLYEIVCNEKKEDATDYLNDLLEKTYRERENNAGEMVDITDDDVSVAIIVSKDYFSNQSEESSTSTTIQNKIELREMFYEEKLRTLLSHKGEFNQEKYEWLDGVFRYLIDEYRKNIFDKDMCMKILEENFNADITDKKEIYLYAIKSGVIENKPFKIVCSGGVINAD